MPTYLKVLPLLKPCNLKVYPINIHRFDKWTLCDYLWRGGCLVMIYINWRFSLCYPRGNDSSYRYLFKVKGKLSGGRHFFTLGSPLNLLAALTYFNSLMVINLLVAGSLLQNMKSTYSLYRVFHPIPSYACSVRIHTYTNKIINNGYYSWY